MKVFVTGGTGFVGSHTVRALLNAGHDVRLFVRDTRKVSQRSVEIVEGDVTDRAAVKKGVAGCDAVLHAANVFSLRRRDHVVMRRVNPAGTRIVLDAGIAAGCNPVVHVSSLVALLGGVPRGAEVSADGPLGRPMGVYARTKRDADAIARELQSRGHPVVITYPGSVWGPDDPYLGESSTTALQMAQGKVPLTTTGGFCVAHVDDVAAVHAAAMRPHERPRRYPALGRYVRHCDLQRMVCREAGVRHLNLPLPPSAPMLTLPLFKAIAALGIHWANSPDGAYIAWRDNHPDNTVAVRELGVRFRSVEEAVRDTVVWLGSAGHLRNAPRYALP